MTQAGSSGDGVERGVHDEVVEHAPPSPSPAWWRRPTVAALRKQETLFDDGERLHDKRENDETRLPEGESIHLAGLVLVEAFTPSSISKLYAALEWLPPQRADPRTDWRDMLRRSRTTGETGWQNLGAVRRPGRGWHAMGRTDPDLPQGVEAVWLSVHYEMPSVAIVVATFCLNEDEGDLSPLLRREYHTRSYDLRVNIDGPLGRVRARVPWARPEKYGMSMRVDGPSDQKRKACFDLVNDFESRCAAWFRDRFPGRFALSGHEARPRLRLFVTQEAEPLLDDSPALRVVDLDEPYNVWRSSGSLSGWSLAPDAYSRGDAAEGRFIVRMAARRRDAARAQNGESGESKWYLVQRFATYQTTLASKYCLWALVSLYAERLALLRDRAGGKGRQRRPVSEARALDDYLSEDGLDVATVVPDLRKLVERPDRFELHFPDYVGERRSSRASADRPAQEPEYFAAALRERMEMQATRLERDTQSTTAVIRASADLRQAISNARLQRFVLTLSLLALIVAIVSL